MEGFGVAAVADAVGLADGCGGCHVDKKEEFFCCSAVDKEKNVCVFFCTELQKLFGTQKVLERYVFAL